MPAPCRLFALLLLGMAASAVRADDTGNFYALFYDGSHVSAPALNAEIWWSDTATIGGRRLFGTENPVRVLQAMTPRAVMKGPRVVMANGDVLPGRITGFMPAVPAEGTPARLLVSLDGSLVAPDPRGLFVRADRVLRLASAGPGADVEPGTLLLASRPPGWHSPPCAGRAGPESPHSQWPHGGLLRHDRGPWRAPGGCDAGSARR